MFTGIIEEIGTIRNIERHDSYIRLKIEAEIIMNDLQAGASIAVNGICLTAVDIGEKHFSADVSPETMRRSSLGRVNRGDLVNLERALRPVDRLGGHIVSGHIDGTAILEGKATAGNSLILYLKAPPELLKYIVEKGSVAVDGISLTVAAVDGRGFSVSLIPHTDKITTLGRLVRGDVLNIECDVVGKYVEKLLYPSDDGAAPIAKVQAETDRLDWDFLRENGF